MCFLPVLHVQRIGGDDDAEHSHRLHLQRPPHLRRRGRTRLSQRGRRRRNASYKERRTKKYMQIYVYSLQIYASEDAKVCFGTWTSLITKATDHLLWHLTTCCLGRQLKGLITMTVEIWRFWRDDIAVQLSSSAVQLAMPWSPLWLWRILPWRGTSPCREKRSFYSIYIIYLIN